MRQALSLVTLLLAACPAPRSADAGTLPDAVALRDSIIVQFTRSADAWTGVTSTDS